MRWSLFTDSRFALVRVWRWDRFFAIQLPLGAVGTVSVPQRGGVGQAGRFVVRANAGSSRRMSAQVQELFGPFAGHWQVAIDLLDR